MLSTQEGTISSYLLQIPSEATLEHLPISSKYKTYLTIYNSGLHGPLADCITLGFICLCFLDISKNKIPQTV